MPPVFPDTLSFPPDLERQFEKYTYSANVRSTAHTRWNMKIISGLQAEYQDNRIDGRGFIIPAFDQVRTGAYLVIKQEISANSLLSAGLRYDLGHINIQSYTDWFPSPAVEGADTTLIYVQRSEKLSKRYSNLTWTIGYNLNLEHFMLKANVGKSFRMPLAMELAANGVNYHRFSYEVGDPDLSPETAYQLDAGMEWHTLRFAIGLSPFLTWFPNYIYLNPSYEHDRLYGNGNQVFNYTQSKVIRYGGEIHTHYQLFRTLRIGLIGEYINTQQLSGEKEGFTIPFSPPASFLLSLKYSRDRIWRLLEPYAILDVRLVAAQNRIVPPEEPTPGYQVMHIGIGSKFRLNGHVMSVSIQVQNLLNRKYFDHTSYYRLINVPEPGRNLIMNITIPFSGQLQNNKS
jgi:iron complex outermembrane receptor protein